MAGETGPVSVSLPIAMVMAGFFAVAMFNAGEILLSIFRLFRRRRRLYFWSLLIASLGIPVHSIAVLLRFFALAPNLPMCVVTVVGWWAMVTGQSVVLCSRLHLVVCDLRKIRWSFIMVATNFCILHIPVSILFLASNSGNPKPFLSAFNVYEKIQLAGFSLQESILAGLYLWEAIHGLKPLMDIKGAEGKSMIRHLIILFVVVVILDISLMTTEYTNNFQIQTTYKPVVYSVKLKIELSILNRLIAFTRMSTSSRHYLESNPAGDFSHSSARGVVSANSAQPSDRGEHTSAIGMGPIKKYRTDHIFDGRSDPSITPSMPP